MPQKIQPIGLVGSREAISAPTIGKASESTPASTAKPGPGLSPGSPFRQRPDTLVVDELLYGHYLRVTGTDHPGDQEVTASMDCDSECVIKEVILGPRKADSFL